MRKLLRKSKNRYLISFIVLLMIILSMGVKPLITDIMGESILIKTMAYDPRDVFRGDYVDLNYEINQIDLNKLDQDILEVYVEKDYFISHELRNEIIYVTLTKSGKYYEVEKVTLTRPREGIYLIGEYSYTLDMGIENGVGIRVEYALDKYFVPENTGRELEEKIRNGDAYALIKVYNGYPLLKEIITE
ncbi:GDYXXLXY domain-containing protein [Mycoplasmatota bacterium]|nr:GDYXXLXY domain-containing protein [Mycoplasmatota bacterium]